jgi:hypothetical protein
MRAAGAGPGSVLGPVIAEDRRVRGRALPVEAERLLREWFAAPVDGAGSSSRPDADADADADAADGDGAGADAGAGRA